MGSRNSKSKELFLIEALRLFAERGYDAVSVSEIGAALGFSPPALYKHFESKQALFDALLRRSEEGFESSLEEFGMDFKGNPKRRAEFLRMGEDAQVEAVKRYFAFAMTDERAALFRKMIAVEQFHRPELGAAYNRRYIERHLESMESLIREFITAGIMRDENPRVMALQFVSPISMYIGVCDRAPEKLDEALEMIEAHVRQFYAVYRA